ncbi:hypothetical protein CB1_000905004 [Camelus ferus]|nr:hypothetical protein CB1_000905004 [Camelus ferus]
MCVLSSRLTSDCLEPGRAAGRAGGSGFLGSLPVVVPPVVSVVVVRMEETGLPASKELPQTRPVPRVSTFSSGHDADTEDDPSPVELPQTFCCQLEELIRWLYNVADVTDHLTPPKSSLISLKSSLQLYRDVLGRISKQPSELESHADHLYDTILSSLDMLAGCTLLPDSTPVAHSSTSVKGISLVSGATQEKSLFLDPSARLRYRAPALTTDC